MAMRGVFEEVLAGRKQDKVRATEVFKYIVSGAQYNLLLYFRVVICSWW